MYKYTINCNNVQVHGYIDMKKMTPRAANSSGPEAETPAGRMKRALGQLGITQTEVARRISTSTSYINDVIRGRRSMTEAFANTLQIQFGIDKIWLRYGEGQMFRRLPPQPVFEGGGLMSPLPLLERPCDGNPLDSGSWAGSTHPVPRGQARPSALDCYRYVLRVSGQGTTGDIRDGDLVIVETKPARSLPDLQGGWCCTEVNNTSRIQRIKNPRTTKAKILGRCVGIVWRPLPNPG